jgi:hypothetical protein
MPLSSRFVRGDKSIAEIKRGVHGGFEVRNLTTDHYTSANPFQA